MNFISMLMCNESYGQYQNIDLCCAIIIEIKNVAINNMSIIKITSLILETDFYCKNSCIIVLQTFYSFFLYHWK